MAMNVWTIEGYIAGKPELKSIHDGQRVLNFTIGHSPGKDRETLWVDCDLWGKRAETMSQYLDKGGRVIVSGSMDHETFQKKDGSMGFRLKCKNIDKISMESRKEAEARRSSGGFQPEAKEPPSSDPSLDTIPF
jgi:single-strand DNA-binding protein